MARPKKDEETFPIHTRLSTSQLAGFREYLRRQQEQIRHTGVQLTDAAVLRGMVLRCLEEQGIPHTSQQSLPLGASPAARPASEPPAPPPPPPPAEPPPPPPAEPAPKSPPAPAPAKKKSPAAKRSPTKAATAKGSGSKVKNKPSPKGRR